MTYEARKLLNDKYRCPRCGAVAAKAGSTLGKKRRRCTECKYQFYEENAITLTKIRVELYNERSVIVGISKEFKSITLEDVKAEIPNKIIMGWYRE